MGHRDQAQPYRPTGEGFYISCEDLQPDRRFVVNAGSGSNPIDDRTTAIGVHELAIALAPLAV
ncbi:MAG: hypothetical protein WAN35_13225 [Terracidiphilus sp.]